MKRLSALITAAVLAAACAAFAGCGSNKEAAKETKPATTSAVQTTAAQSNTEKPSQAAQTQASDTKPQVPETTAAHNGATPGITSEDASAKALEQQPSGYKVTSCSEGVDESGDSVWEVTLTPDGDGLKYVYYVKKDSCVLAYMDDKDK